MFWNTARIWPAPLLLYYATSSLGQSSSNRTIDDQKGDPVTGFIPTYLPNDRWNIGQTCATCAVKPSALIDPGRVFDGTWHDTTHYGQTDANMSVQIDFTGTAVYMYNILVNIVAGPQTSLTMLHFYLDGDQVGTFTHDRDDTTEVIYNALVYKNTSLSNTPHSLRAEASGAQSILYLFDYVIYTVEDNVEFSSQGPTTSLPSPTSSSSLTSASPQPSPEASTSVGAIIGGAVGGFLVLGVVAVLSLCLLYRRRRSRDQQQLPSRGGSPRTQASQRDAENSDFAITPYIASEESRSMDGSSEKFLDLLIKDNFAETIHTASAARTAPFAPSIATRSVSTYESSIAPPHTNASSSRTVELALQIQALQAQVANLRAMRGAAHPAVDTPSDTERSLAGELAAFRREMATLRAELGDQQQYTGMAQLDLPPSYGV
ncbi:uncharacterized protein TRAVEDRAFT_49259 [Trametes versicolor FP-101664 SS1]|uniref:uncharacterized protein n=1 Tax=Trametes versicolor (strain FP-101664) TaxID=717944 RepID=UPI000462415B|nr:uncharacterized protein TRAVEDRAFT_49259 [Trametes versicolor FP-101664 SS1]EIW56434.1 hypothetical protein TRAVEDRAFT_49259 [Trametes versicolor FP-101664 SS1]